MHSVYETTMLDEHAAEVVAGVNADLADDRHGPPLVTGSGEAADAAVALMQRTIEEIRPADIVSVFAALNQVLHQIRPVAEIPSALPPSSVWQTGQNAGDAMDRRPGAKAAARRSTPPKYSVLSAELVLQKLYNTDKFRLKRVAQGLGDPCPTSRSAA